MDEGEISKTDSLNTPAFQNPEVDTTEILSTECVASEGKSVRQNTCSVCGAFGHNKKFHKKKCKICHTSGHVSFRCPNKSTAKEAGTSSLKSIDELHFPERERRGTKQDLTQGEMDITARVLLCCHNEKKWKEIQSIKDISQRASMYTGISKATCASIYKQLKEGHWPEKGPSKRGKYDRETHNLKKKPTDTKETKNNKTRHGKQTRAKNASKVSKTSTDVCLSSYDTTVNMSQAHQLNEITVSTLPMQITSHPCQQNYTLLTSTSNMQPGSSVLSNLLGTQHCPPTICDQTQSHFQGMVTQTVSSMQPNQQQQVQQHQHQQHQQQQHQQHQVHQQQVPQQQLNQQHQVDTFYIQVPV
ncbi:uncharacterized protein LOC117105746 isoform X1 [Anneissia japonica]|uniref:uncharacterized protein LOC117105746 isoform X1 n=1 Tax=Anneissia japonica TaxID=1529436 RepID=UPI00142595BB|nr:uncharacterized protein LOC117105746 isoform X1 [Anneissia japonica]